MFSQYAQYLEAMDTTVRCPSFQALREEWLTSCDEHVDCETTDERYAYQTVVGLFHAFLDRAGTASRPFRELSVAARKRLAAHLFDRKQSAQRTEEWYKEAQHMLTASEFADIFSAPRTRGHLVMSKVAEPQPMNRRLACPTASLSPFDWGIRFEPVVKQILEGLWGARIEDCGRVYHPTLERLAASPDGVILAATDPVRVGRLVEIKCPISRKVGQGIPFKYWCQMQIQMEVSGIHECEYVEITFEKECAADAAEGWLWLLSRPVPTVEDCLEYRYAYTEPERDAAVAEGWSVAETVPWRRREMHNEVVAFDPHWFASTLPVQEQFWEDVEAAKRGEFVVPASSREKVCLILDE